MKKQAYLSALVILLFAVGCDSGHGPDSLFAPRSGSAADSGCARCHNAASLIAPDPLLTNGTGTQGSHVRHVQILMLPCERCHTSYETMATHMNGVLDTADPATQIVYFDVANPGGSWANDTGAGTGRCSGLACHGTGTPNWYASGWVLPPCTECHFQIIGPRRPVTGTAGDFASNPGISSHHVTGGVDPVSGQCLVCHNLSTHATGTVLLRQADTDAAIVYSPASPTTLEPFCLSCHDADGALTSTNSGSALDPFNDGSTLGSVPNAAGNKIAGYWNAAYAAHRNNGLTCAGSGAPNTGCHGSGQMINMHGSVSSGLLTRNLTLPVPASSAYDYNYFKLCFDCHDNYAAVTKEVVLGYRQGGNYDVSWAPSPYSTPTTSIRSLFRDRYIGSPLNFPPYWSGIDQPYNENFWGDPFMPLHNYHLSPTDPWMQNIWYYRGLGSNIGRASCITCHNVHGTNGTVRSVYDEFGLVKLTGAGGDIYGRLEPIGNYEDIVFKNYPITCAMSCHSIVPGTSYWHTPDDE